MMPGLLVVLALVLGLVLYEARSSTAVVWAIGLVGLSVLAAFAWRWVLRRTTDPGPLVRPAEPAAVHTGEIEVLTQSARRASRGLSFSQVVVAMRAREAFLERVRLSLGLSPDAIREAEADPAALRRLTHDRVLAEFLHLPARGLEERYRWVQRARARGGFAREFRDVLDRMEAWQ
jgi:hypothetical protein